MPERLETGNISLGGFEYELKPGTRVRRFLASQPPPRMIIGDLTAGVTLNESRISWSDFRGGIGIDKMNPDKDQNRAWYGTCNLRHSKNIVPGPLATATTMPTIGSTFSVGAMIERANIMYAAFGPDIYAYNSTTDSWGSSLKTMGANATHAINFRHDGTEFIAFANGTEYTLFDGSTWSTEARDATYLQYWHSRLWGVDSTGLLWSATVMRTDSEADDAQLPLPNDFVSNLFQARSPDGDIVLFASTLRGLFIHDFENSRWNETELDLPFHPENGLGATRWQDSAYISSGLGVYKYINGSNSAVISVVGPDRDHGLPANRRGVIRQLLTTLNELVALVDATTSPSALSVVQPEDGGDADVIQPDSGFSTLLGYDGLGWQVLWESADDTLAITTATISNAYNDYRLWWAQNEIIYWLRLPRDIINPDHVTDQEYNASSTLETPWFDADETFTDKLALRLAVYLTDASATSTLKVAYRLDNDDNPANETTLGTITATGNTEYLFPNATAPVGLAFKTIKFVFTMVRGATTTDHVNLGRVEFYFERRTPVRWGFSTTLIIAEHAGLSNQSPMEMYDNIIAAIAAGTLQELTYRNLDANTDGDSNPYNHYVRIINETGLDSLAFDFSGEFTLNMVEL